MRRLAKAPSAGPTSGIANHRGVALLSALVLAITVSLGAATALADTPPSVTIAPVSGVSYTSAHLSGTVNPNGGPSTTGWHFEYSTDPGTLGWNSADGGEISGAEAEGTNPVPVEANLGGLTPSTKYEVRLVATNDGGQTITAGPNPSFETLAVAKPSVAINPVAQITGTSAQFSGTVNPNAPGAAPQNSAFNSNWHFECTPACPGLQGGTVQADNSAHLVKATAYGLLPGVNYEVRLQAGNAGGSNSTASSFATPAIGPGAFTLDAGIVTQTSAELGGKVNPNNAATTYWVEYGTSTAYGTSIPAGQNANAGSGSSYTAVDSFEVGGLLQATTYHFRIVAKNATGTTNGLDHTFTTLATPLAQSCANEAIRVEQRSTFLGSCRAYEQVSPAAEKNANDIAPVQGAAAPDGNAVTYVALGSFGSSKSGPAVVRYLSRRSGSGWSTKNISTQKNPTSIGPLSAVDSFLAFTPDLSVGALRSPRQQTAGAPTGVFNVYTYDTRTDSFTLHSPAANGLPSDAFFEFPTVAALSDDGSTVLFQSKLALTPDATPSRYNLYVSRDGELELASILPNGSPATEGAGAEGGPSEEYSADGLSADGSRIYFRSPLGGGPLYLREDGTTVEVSASEATVPEAEHQGANLQLATDDGSRVLFTTYEGLVDEDTNGLEDLYQYTVSAPAGDHLQLISKDSESADIGDGRRNFYVLGLAEDGSSGYFVSNQQLLAGKPLPTGGLRYGLYRWSGSGLAYLGEVDESDASSWSRSSAVNGGKGPQSIVSPDGDTIAFAASSQLTSYDNQGTKQLYVYRVGRGFSCASCGGLGDTAPQSLSGQEKFGVLGDGMRTARFMSSDSERAYFVSPARLAAEDINGLPDVYEWQDGEVSLVSSGTSTSRSNFVSSGADSTDVFFTTRSRLVGADRDDSLDMYDARTGGGFVEPVPPPLPCEGENCHGAISSAPALPSAGSAGFSGPGDAKPKRHKAKKRHQKRKSRQGKGKSNKGGKHHAKRADANRGAGK